MAVSFKVALQKSGLKPFKYRWVLIAACATFAWLSLRNTPRGAARPAATGQQSSAPGAADELRRNQADGGNGTAGAATTGRRRSSLRDKAVASASFGMSTINVIVHPNDTLDAIFRRLKLSLDRPGLLARPAGAESTASTACDPANRCASCIVTARSSASSGG